MVEFYLNFSSSKYQSLKHLLLILKRAYCAYCHDRIWGLGRQGFRCNICKLLIHKKCHKLIRVSCDPNTPWPPRQPSGTGSGSGASMGDTAPLERTKGANGAMEQGIYSCSNHTYCVLIIYIGIDACKKYF